MKKLISLLLAALLCLSALTPALAQSLSDLLAGSTPSEDATAFAYTADEYRVVFDELSVSRLKVTPVWTLVDGRHIAAVEGYGEVVITIDEAGFVTSLYTEVTCTVDDLGLARNFGMLLAMAATASKMVENPAFLFSGEADVLANGLSDSLNTLTANIAQAVRAPISHTAEVCGNTVTYTCALDIAANSLTFSFTFEP